MAVLSWIVVLHKIASFWVSTFLKKIWELVTNYLGTCHKRSWNFPQLIWELVTNYLGVFLTVVFVNTDVHQWHPSHGLIFCTKLTPCIESYIFFPEWIREFLSLDCFCKLQSHLTIVCCELSLFPALMEPIPISIQDLPNYSVTDIF